MDTKQAKYRISQNILSLRKARGESQAELGKAINKSKQAISNYEVGYKTPELATIMAIADHYGVSVGRFLYGYIEALDTSNLFVSFHELMDILDVMFPLLDMQDSSDDLDFEHGYKLHKGIIDSLKADGYVFGFDTKSEQCVRSYTKSLDQRESPESAANMLGLIFLLWDATNAHNYNRLVEAEKIGWVSIPTDLQKLKCQMRPDKNKDKSFCEDFNPIVLELIKLLKNRDGWSDLGDYYLALRMFDGLADTDTDPSAVREGGLEMMISLASIGNKYAFNLLDRIVSL